MPSHRLPRSLFTALALALLFAVPALGARQSGHSVPRSGTSRPAHKRAASARKPGTFVVRLRAKEHADAAGLLLGDTAVESQYDFLRAGEAEAFRLRAQGSGRADTVHVFVSAKDSARVLVAGIYSSASGEPAKILSAGAVERVAPGSWASVSIPPVELVSGSVYWLAILGQGGKLSFRDRPGGPCPSESSATHNLHSLPGRWRTGKTYRDCPVSAYLTVAGSSLSEGFGVSSPLAAESSALPEPPPPPPSAPVETALPEISGTPTQGKLLDASNGSWSGDPSSYAYEWEDCNSAGEKCAAINGATSTSYQLTSHDVGHTVRVSVTATNAGGSTKATSDATSVVAAEGPTAAPVNVVPPSVSGTGAAGQTLTASKGSWTESPTSYAYQWQDCSKTGGACANITNATSATYQLADGDVGHTVRVVVTAKNAIGSTKANSEVTAVIVSEAPVQAPVNTGLPTVSGTAEEGQTLTASKGSWTNNPTSYAYQWEDCSDLGEGCANIGGATGSTYKLAAGDVGDTVRVVVTATNAGGSGQASSEASAVVVSQLISGQVVFVSQSGAGSQTGESSCSEARPLSWLNNASNWGSGGGHIGPGTTVTLCGTISQPVEVLGGGSSGNPVTVTFASGAKIAMPVCPGSGCLHVASGTEYLTIDGANTGIIESTNSGTGKEGQAGAVITGIKANGCKHCLIENLTIANLYVAQEGDQRGNTEIKGIVISEETPEYITVKNDVFHDMGWAINIEVEPNSTNILVENNTFTHLTHGFALSAGFSGGDIGPVVFAHNHFSANENWNDGAALTNHVDMLHCYSSGAKGYTPHYSGIYIYDNYATLEGEDINTPIFIEGGSGGGSTPCADSTSPVWVFNNVLHTSFEVGNGVLGVTSGEPHVLNNTVIGSETHEGVCLHFNSVAENVQLKNNLATTCQQDIYAETARFAAGGVDYNLYANAGTGDAFVCNGNEYPNTGFAKWQSCTGQDAHGKYAVEAKLNLNETPGQQGKPESGSPALQAGINLTGECSTHPPFTSGLCQNITGEARPTTGPWNIGAY